jgi:hypothetical protein
MIAEKPAGRHSRRGGFLAAVRISSHPVRVLALCLALVFAVGSASELCDGWSSDAAGRAACCARMETHCATWSADDCCAQGEQRQNREQVRSFPQPARDMTAAARVLPTMPSMAVESALPAAGQKLRPHLLHAVFLI